MAARHTHGKGLITDLTKYDNGVEFSLDTDRCCILVGPISRIKLMAFKMKPQFATVCVEAV